MIVWCGLMKERIIGPFSFCEPTVTGPMYLDMLEHVYLQVTAFQPSIIYQPDGAPHTGVWILLIDELDSTDRYVGHHVHRI